MRLQLIHPPAFLNPTALTALRPALPLGLAYVAGSARQAGHDVSVIDAVGEAPDKVVRDGNVSVLGLDISEVVERLDDDVQVVGIGEMFTYQWRHVQKLATAIKEARPDVLLVGGGEHFTGLPELSLEQAPFDVVALGEGEETMVDILRRYGAFLEERGGDPGDPAELVPEWAEGCPGIGYRGRDGEVVLEERRARVRDVDGIPPPAWDLLQVLTYDQNRFVSGIRKGITVPILATRGCPYRCAYCSSKNMWTTKWVARDPKLVADEIEGYVEKYGARNFPFHDLTAILKKQWIVDFCKEIVDRKLDISWQLPSGTRCEVVDEEVSELLAKSGGWSLNFAPESGSEEVREKIKKQMTEKSLFDAVAAASKHKLNTSCFFVLGFPNDKIEDYRETLRWARRLARSGVDDLAVGFFFPIPGTQFWGELEEIGKVQLTEETMMAPIFVHDRWLTEGRNFSLTQSARTLTYWRYRIVLAFYIRAVLLNPKRLWRLLRNFAKALLRHVRSSDIVARYGGEEFLVVLPGIGEEAAAQVVRRQRQGRTVLALADILEKVGIKFSSQRRERMERIDADLSKFWNTHQIRFLAALSLHFVGRVLRAVDVWVIGWLLGMDLNFLSAYVISAAAVIINAAFSFIPGALGVYEGGHGLLLKTLGVGMDGGVSMGILRRVRTMTFAGLSYLLLVFRPDAAEARKAAAEDHGVSL